MIRRAKKRTQQAAGRLADEEGLVSLWVLALMLGVIVFSMVTLSLWTGNTAREQLLQMAEAGARSGANAIDDDAFNRDGLIRLDSTLAERYAFETLREQPAVDRIDGWSLTVDQATVTVVLEGRDPLLGRPVRVAADAEPRIER